ELGNTVVVIEHNLDVIKTADWIIDLGPEAGIEGGWIVAEGTPEDVVARAQEYRKSSANGRQNGAAMTTGGPAARTAPAGSRSDKKPRHAGQSAVRRTVSIEGERSSFLSARAGAEMPPFRSYTGELLAEVLKAGRRSDLEVFDARGAARRREGD